MNTALGTADIARHETDPTRTVRLLEAVRSFTAERERDELISTLLRSMVEVLPAQAIELRPFDGDGELSRMRVLHPAMATLGDDLSPVTRRMRVAVERSLKRLKGLAGDNLPVERAEIGRGYSLHTLMGSRGPAGIVAIEHMPTRGVDPDIVDALLRIYSNFIVVIDDSHRDTLTGLLNRKTFEHSIQTVLLETREAAGKPLRLVEQRRVEQRRGAPPGACHWLAVMDIDHFKRINDAFGHLYGDEVLILLSRMMLQSFRKSDRVYRFGGEEFAVLLSPCKLDDARAVLLRFREAVQNREFPQVGQVTISIGFVGVTVQDIPATVIAHADEALYASKHAGRNRVTGYMDLQHAQASPQVSSVDLF